MQYYDDKLCVTLEELTGGASPLMSQRTFRRKVRTGQIEVLRAGNGRGNITLVSYDSLSVEYRQALSRECIAEKNVTIMTHLYERCYHYDEVAGAYFANQTISGEGLKSYKIRELATNASVLNALILLQERGGLARSASSDQPLTWREICAASSYYRTRHGHTLPDTTARLREKLVAYRREGYSSLISGRYGNSNRRKVDDKVGKILLQLAARSNQPFVEQIYEDYNAFVRGELAVVDPTTGEVFSADDYKDKSGMPITLSKRTIDNYLSRSDNALLIAAARESRTTFYHNHMPHLHRERPEYSMSKVTFDDRDLPRKERSTKKRPKAYYAYDVCSGVCLGKAYSRSKDVDLVVEMFRDFFRTLRKMGIGMPMQVEVENHLMSQWRDGFLKAGEVFPFVHFCAPQNSQEKSAEHFNRSKKIQVEHRHQDGIGRFYAKNRAYIMEKKKISDSENNTYEEREYYSWEELIADDEAVIELWNNLPHSNQKKYPGMTKMEVFLSRLNPQISELQPHILAKYIGEHRDTSLRRSDYCRINYRDWHISSAEVICRLKGPKVTAYWLPEPDGSMPDEIYMYQGDRYIDTLKPIEKYQEAVCERTGDDWRVMQAQLSRRDSFASWVDEHSISPAIAMSEQVMTQIEESRESAEEIIITPAEEEEVDVMPDREVDVSALAVGDL